MIEQQNLDGVPDTLGNPVIFVTIAFCALWYAPLHYVLIGGESAIWYLVRLFFPALILAYAIWLNSEDGEE